MCVVECLIQSLLTSMLDATLTMPGEFLWCLTILALWCVTKLASCLSFVYRDLKTEILVFLSICLCRHQFTKVYLFPLKLKYFTSTNNFRPRLSFILIILFIKLYLRRPFTIDYQHIASKMRYKISLMCYKISPFALQN